MSGRFGLAVLTDLSASMFVACFMILLIFLSLVQTQAQAPRPAVEAERTFAVVRRSVPSSTAMVGLLFSHRHAAEGTALDLFAKRVVVYRDGVAETLASGTPPGRLAEPIRLYVFSNETYAGVLGALEANGAKWTEMSVPAALREADAPEDSWSDAFTELEERTSDRETFRSGLAALLDAAPSPRAASASSAGLPTNLVQPQDSAPAGILDRVRAWLAFLAAVLAPLVGGAAVVTIERRRFRGVLAPG